MQELLCSRKLSGFQSLDKAEPDRENSFLQTPAPTSAPSARAKVVNS